MISTNHESGRFFGRIYEPSGDSASALSGCLSVGQGLWPKYPRKCRYFGITVGFDGPTLRLVGWPVATPGA